MRKERTFHVYDSGFTLAWYLHAEKKTIQFTVMFYKLEHWIDMATDIGYHADEEQYRGQETIECTLRPSGKCYYDGSGLAAEQLWKKFQATKDEEVIWKELEAHL